MQILEIQFSQCVIEKEGLTNPTWPTDGNDANLHLWRWVGQLVANGSNGIVTPYESVHPQPRLMRRKMWSIAILSFSPVSTLLQLTQPVNLDIKLILYYTNYLQASEAR
jgi:hypothetical protein